MEIIIAIAIGTVAACATILLTQRSLFRILIGLALIAQAANVLVFTAAGLGRGDTPVIPADAEALAEGHPDPLAQALVLTAIVISFGVLAFCLVLLNRAYRRTSEADVDALARAES
jgi:multicomponent Na+:H+ antiporter subunit C